MPPGVCAGARRKGSPVCSTGRTKVLEVPMSKTEQVQEKPQEQKLTLN